MLTNLIIKNFILIENLDISFGHNLTVFTGETGAGKSILIDAVSFILGARSDISQIQNGKDFTSVTATFDTIKNNVISDILTSYDIPFTVSNTDNIEIILRRNLTKDGKNKIFVNDIPVSLGILKTIGDNLIEIHGQFDNQSLLNPATHIDIVDNFAAVEELKDSVKKLFTVYKNKETEYKNLSAEFDLAKKDEEYLKFNLNELQQLSYKQGEEEQLQEKKKLLFNKTKNITAINDAFKHLSLYGDEPQNFITSAISSLNRISNKAQDNNIKTIIDSLETAGSNLLDSYERLNDLLSGTDNEEQELEDTETRLYKLKEISRKHNIAIDEIYDFTNKLQEKVDNINNTDEILTAKKNEVLVAKNEYLNVAKILSQKRIETAKILEEKINKELPPLKLEKAKISVIVNTFDDENKWSANGINTVYFMGTTNAGMPENYIHKIASGGELARFTLAIKVIVSSNSSIGTFIFDEVDTGISGATASAVGERLARLSHSVQTLVITHSPQVAGYSNHHFKVSKYYDDKKKMTITKVDELNETQKITEIARIISGDKITNEAVMAAKQLYNSSFQLKN